MGVFTGVSGRTNDLKASYHAGCRLKCGCDLSLHLEPGNSSGFRLIRGLDKLFFTDPIAVAFFILALAGLFDGTTMRWLWRRFNL